MNSKRWSRSLILLLTLIGLTLVSTAVSARSPTEDPGQPQPETWVSGKTSVSDLSDQEKAQLTGVPASLTRWEAQQAALWRASAAPRQVSYPGQVDWRSHLGGDYTTAIRNQRGCGSCVAFAVNAAIESRLEIVRDTPALDPDLSEDHLFFCGGGHCSGWYPGAALDFARDTGIVDEACQPYDPDSMSCDPCPDWQDRLTKIKDYRTSWDANEVKAILANDGPVISLFDVYSDFYSYVSGIYKYTSGDRTGSHAVALVGYDDTAGYWIAKNSWGTGWGEQGWFRIAYGEVGIDDYFFIPILDEPTIQVSSNRLGSVAGLDFAPADIIAIEPSGTWRMLFDASDLGIPDTVDLHAFTVDDKGRYLLTFDQTVSLPGLPEAATPWQVVRFSPFSLGEDTLGTFSACQMDTYQQLSTSDEQIDALHYANNRLYLSTRGAYEIDQGPFSLSGPDEDILEFIPNEELCASHGSWDRIFSNQSQGIPELVDEDIQSLWFTDTAHPHVSLTSDFSILGVTGSQKDILQLHTSYNALNAASIHWHGPDAGYQAAVDGLHIAGLTFGDSSITLCESVFPADETAFEFASELGSFTLRDPSARCKTFSNLLPNVYQFLEQLPQGWHAATRRCLETSNTMNSSWVFNGRSDLTIDLGVQSTVSCQFVNMYDPFEPNEILSSAKEIAYGDTIQAAIAPHPAMIDYEDRDLYFFTGSAGDTVMIEITSEYFRPEANRLHQVDAYALNPLITLKNETGENLVTVEDEALVYQLPTDGTYFILVRGWGYGEGGIGEQGPYMMALTEPFRIRAGTYLSPEAPGALDGVTFEPADILFVDDSGSWQMVFDASDLGIPETADLHAFTLRDDGTILMVFDPEVSLPGLSEPATPWDIVRFTPEQLGPLTAGSFDLYLNGSAVGLDSAGEKIDGLHEGALPLVGDYRIFMSFISGIGTGPQLTYQSAGPTPKLFISVNDRFSVTQDGRLLTADDEDILLFSPAALGERTNGRWGLWWDGSAHVSGIAAEELNAMTLPVLEQSGYDILAVFADAYTFDEISGDENDVARLTARGGDEPAQSIWWHGADFGFTAGIDGLHVVP